MVVRVRANIRKIRKTLKRQERRQVPFAASLALNDVAFGVRHFIVRQLWPRSFPAARNKRFPGVAFRVTRKATKRRLTSEVSDRLNRSFIEHHIRGLPKTAFTGGSLAVPINVNRTSTGKIGKRRQPRNIINSFVEDKVGRGPAIWQRLRGGRLRLMYVLKQSTPVRRVFPFFREGERRGVRLWPRAFSKGIRRALRTAR